MSKSKESQDVTMEHFNEELQVRRIWIKPAEKCPKVRDPETMRHLKPYGREVTKGTHWIRQIGYGDVDQISKEEYEKGKADYDAKLAEDAEKAAETKTESTDEGSAE